MPEQLDTAERVRLAVELMAPIPSHLNYQRVIDERCDHIEPIIWPICQENQRLRSLLEKSRAYIELVATEIANERDDEHWQTAAQIEIRKQIDEAHSLLSQLTDLGIEIASE